MQVAADKHAAVGGWQVVMRASLHKMQNLQKTAQAASECRKSTISMCVICKGTKAQQEVPCGLLIFLGVLGPNFCDLLALSCVWDQLKGNWSDLLILVTDSIRD